MNDFEMMIGADENLFENIGIRDSKVEIFGILDKVFLSRSFDVSKTAFNKSDLDLGMLINWIDENITKRYLSKRDVDEAYSNLSIASKYFEKANRTNHYEYFRYASTFASSGISISNKGRNSLLKQYTFPSNIRYMSTTKADRSTNNSIAEKLAYLKYS